MVGGDERLIAQRDQKAGLVSGECDTGADGRRHPLLGVGIVLAGHDHDVIRDFAGDACGAIEERLALEDKRLLGTSETAREARRENDRRYAHVGAFRGV